jgi:glycerophosphoryl diester phosphodiesterase
MAGGEAIRASKPRDTRPGPLRIIAHRGGAAHAPENTLPAFRRSLEAGIPEVETDLRIARDGRLVLFHDADLAEKTHASGPVEAHDAADLCATDIGSWFDRHHPEHSERFAGTGLLALDDLFAAFGRRLYYHLELKGADPELPERTLATVAAAGLLSRATLTSFSREHLQRARALDAAVPLTWLLARARGAASPVRLQRARIEAAVEERFDEVSLAADEVSPRLVAFAHGLGLAVRAWRVRGREDMARVVEAGVDGMTLDDPDLLVAHLLANSNAGGFAKPA